MVDVALDLVKPTAEDYLFDPGCGDGRIVITAAKRYGCRAIGIEIDPVKAAQARENVRRAGVDHLVCIRDGDARRDILLPGATIVVLYLYPELIDELLPRIEDARSVVSISHSFAGARRYEYSGRSIFVRNK